MSFSPISLLAAGVLLGAGASVGATNLIVNGDFSSPAGNGGYTESTSIPGWTSNTGDFIEVGNTGLYGLPCVNAACQNLEVNDRTFGSVSQTVTGLTVGQSYSLAYLYGGRPGYGPQILDVSFGGAPLTTNSGSFGVWQANSFKVIATAASETLTFTSEVTSGSPGGGNEVTNVTLGVPEPATWALMIAGFGLVGVAARRRARTVAA